MPSIHRPHAAATLRDRADVTPLELFFDLVFVLALTQCTALMAHEPTWEGIAKGLLVLGVLWWAWTAYAWLTSIVDPEEGTVRLAMFAAMAALLVIALCVPEAFDDLGLVFAGGYMVVRAAQIMLMRLGSRDDPNLRQSTNGLAIGTAIGTGLLVVASQLDGIEQGALWAIALGLDMAEPYFFGAEGWKLVPDHFAERHGLIIIIALGESIVAIGVGADEALTFGISAAAVIGVALAATLWWAYFDVVALAAEHRLQEADPVTQSRLARDSYTYLHFPMVTGIILFALGVKEALLGESHELSSVAAVSLCGGVALYLVALSAFKRRNYGSYNYPRLVAAAVLVALTPLAGTLDAVLALALVAAVTAVLIAYETLRYAAARDRIRHA